MKDDRGNADPATIASRRNRLLRNTGQLAGKALPAVNQHYKEYFRAVDNFNKMLAAAPWPYDIHHEEMFYLIHMIRITAVNGFVAWEQYSGQQPDTTKRPEMQAQFGRMAQTLLMNE